MGRYHNLNNKWRKVHRKGGVTIFVSEVGYIRQQYSHIWKFERRGKWVPVITLKNYAYTPGKLMSGFRRAVDAMRALERELVNIKYREQRLALKKMK